MKPPKNSVPLFALGRDANWGDDLINAMEASVAYQQRHGGKFGPMFVFIPMTDPKDPDTWEPFVGTPENVLIVSIDRKRDARLLKAFARAEPTIGPLQFDDSKPCSQCDGQLPLAEYYAAMERDGITASWCRTGTGEDDLSFFCLRGGSAILAFNKALRELI